MNKEKFQKYITIIIIIFMFAIIIYSIKITSSNEDLTKSNIEMCENKGGVPIKNYYGIVKCMKGELFIK